MAVNPYSTLEAKATRFFDNAEWASASALYDLMLEERPTVPQTYGRAIVANGMRGKHAEQTQLMAKALDHHIPFDSVFSQVKTWSYHIGHPELFETFLIDNRAAHPWMRRTINSYLLKYYTFRRNGPGMVEYSRTMLDGASDNVAFLSSLADGQMLIGQTDEALDTYKQIIRLDPSNYNALLILGNWYAEHTTATRTPDATTTTADTDSGTDPLYYLQRAYQLRPTPYVASLIELLNNRRAK